MLLNEGNYCLLFFKRLKVDTTELHFKKGEEISLEMCHCVTLAALISFSFFCPVTIVLHHKP